MRVSRRRACSGGRSARSGRACSRARRASKATGTGSPCSSGGLVGAAEAVEVEGAAGLGAGAGEAVAAEGLHADHGTDDVAVDVDVAGADAGEVLGHLLVDAGVQAVGQAVAGGVDGFDDLRQVGFLVAQDVEDGAEHLALQLGEVADLEHGGGDEGAGSAVGELRLVVPLGGALHAVDVGLELALRLGVDDRADVGRELRRVADGELVHGALEHGDGAVGHVLLEVEDAQGRAALAGAVEGGGQHVADDLLGQRGAVDDHARSGRRSRRSGRCRRRARRACG